MYIEPSTVIKLYSGVPLNNDYEHTLYFPNKTAQTNYFHNTLQTISGGALYNQSYSRVSRGKMRVQISIEKAYSCNYMAFKNEKFENKWFYAFVTSVEYVNNETVEITFEIDEMQTYMFDVSIKECFIEREHSATDAIGDNIIEEQLSTGDYITCKELKNVADANFINPSLAEYRGLTMIIVMDRFIDVTQPVGKRLVTGSPTLFDGIPQGLAYYRICMGTVSQDGYADFQDRAIAFWNTLDYYAKDEGAYDHVKSIYVVPSYSLYGVNVRNVGGSTEYSQGYLPLIVGPSTQQAGERSGYRTSFYLSDYNDISFEGYTPKNNKLYTYPYRCLEVSNNLSGSQLYRFEFFNGAPVMKLVCVFAIGGKAYMYPSNYLGENDATDLGIGTTEWQIGCYSYDSYLQWKIANNYELKSKDVNTLIGGVSTILGGAMAGAAVGSGVGAVVGAATGALSIATKEVLNHVNASYQGQIANISPNKIIGDIQSGSLLTALHRIDFTFRTKSITGQYAKTIDDYFTKFGYKTNRVKVPNIWDSNTSKRRYWNYVKTVGCTAIGNCPSDDIKAICSIYDKGITFWSDPTMVGNYSANNTPL